MLLSVNDALAAVLGSAKEPETERVPLIQAMSMFLAEDVRQADAPAEDQPMIPRGSLVRSQEIAALGMLGRHKVEVFRRPTISVVTVGDDVVEINQQPAPGKHRNGVAYAIISRLVCANCCYAYLGISAPETESLAMKLSDGFKGDMLLVVAGSPAVHSTARAVEALESMGVRMLFKNVAVDPAGDFAFGMKDKTMVFVLPGRPFDAIFACEFFVLPALGRMTSNPRSGQAAVKAALEGPVGRALDKDLFVPGRMARHEDGTHVFRKNNIGDFSDIKALAETDCFIHVPAGEGDLQAGDPVKAFSASSCDDYII